MFVLDGIFFFLCISGTVAVSRSDASSSTVISNSTCPARTVNYITHSLPQQCLTSTRSSNTRQTGTHASGSPNTVINYGIDTTSSQANPVDTVSTSISTISSVPISGESDIAGHASNISISTTTVAATSISNTTPLPILPAVIDEDSALESGNFLSFEDWKKQNLIKAGQSEHVGKDANIEQTEPRQRPSVLQNSLDSLGDDVEIDLDFSGLVAGTPQKQDAQASVQKAHTTLSQDGVDTNTQPNARKRSKDAGTTCKERFNYASFDCAANILKNNPQAKNSRSVLIENKDAYMLNECSANNKFLILELCDDLLIDTIVLANFEFFSSIFRQVRVSVSDRYPVKVDKWKILGTFEARNTREVQAFLVENPVIWARYLRIEFLTHYGSEYYCPVSLVRIHGTTMLEEYKHDLEMSLGDGDDDEDDMDVAITEAKEVDKLMPEAVDELLVTKAEEVRGDVEEFVIQAENGVDAAEQPCMEYPGDLSHSRPSDQTHATTTSSVSDLAASTIFDPSLPMCSVDSKDADNQPAEKDASSGGARPTRSGLPGSSRVSALLTTTSRDSVHPSEAPTKSNSKVDTGGKKQETKVATSADRSLSATRADINTSTTNLVNTARNSTSSADRARSSSSTVTDRKTVGSTTQPQPASPTMQESFFKSVQKRLQMLESNSSLSLQYIEEQSRSLRDAFRKVEQRQLSKTSMFLNQLNLTMLSELREFRQQYDHLWQSTVIELEMQREQYQQENSAMHARLGVLADELIFQKRIAILQMSLILVCLGLVLFSRGVIHNYLELPIVQSVFSKSPSRRWMSLSNDTTPNAPQLERARSAHQLRAKSSILKGHKRGQSNESDTAPSEAMSPRSRYSPPTPVSYDDLSDPEPFEDSMVTDSLEFDPNTIERPSTSPPVLPSTEEPPTPPRFGGDFDSDSIDTRLLETPPSSAERNLQPFRVKIDEITPRSKHLTWDLPDT